MDLAALLDHVAGHVLDDRSKLLEGAADELYSDELLTRLLNQAEQIFCRKAWAIVDDTTAACCRITLVADQKVYSLHQSVLKVLSATPNDTDIPLQFLNYNLIAPQSLFSMPDYFSLAPLPALDQSGRPGWVAFDEATKKIILRPAPDATAVTDVVRLNLRVARLPITPMSVSTPNVGPEIDDEYHMDLCAYAAGMALQQANVDSDQKGLGREMVSDFYAKLRAARNDRLIAQMSPGQFLAGGWARTVRY